MLKLRRVGDWYAVWKFFDADGRLLSWYVNFETPVRPRGRRHRGQRPPARHRDPGRGEWRWKDVQDLAPSLAAGRITQDELLAVLAAGDRRRRPARPGRPLVGAVGRLDARGWDNRGVTVPNVLATRYAGADLAEIWSPEHKIVLERQLWIAVLKAQRDLGIDVPDGVVEAYESVIDKVDLDSIAARERITRHDVKARIEEFSRPGRARAHPQGHDLARPDRERRAAAGTPLARGRARPRRRRPASGSAGSPPSTRPP